MNTHSKVPDADETPEYPLPSPTDSLSRDQRPPDDEDAAVEVDPEDSDIAGEDEASEPN